MNREVINIGSKTQCDPFNHIKSHCAVQLITLLFDKDLMLLLYFSRSEGDHWHRSALEGGTWCFGSRSTKVDTPSRGRRWWRGGSSWAAPSWPPSSSWWHNMRWPHSLMCRSCHHHHHSIPRHSDHSGLWTFLCC